MKKRGTGVFAYVKGIKIKDQQGFVDALDKILREIKNDRKSK